MGRLQSTRIEADTNVIKEVDGGKRNPCVYRGFILTANGGAPNPNITISVYGDNSGTGTTNLVAQYNSADKHLLDSLEYHYTDGIFCSKGLRIECSDWTNLQMFVLHS